MPPSSPLTHSATVHSVEVSEQTSSSASEVSRTVDVEFKLAQIWHRKGKLERALAGYQRVLQLLPEHALTHLVLPDLLLQLKRIPEAVTAAQQALAVLPNEAKLHKSFVRALVEKDGEVREAFNHYQLTKRDHRTVEITPQEILCCCVVRNEAARLPYFLSFYRHKGVGKFFFVDNTSSDDTVSYLLQQPDVYVWQSPYSFNRANFGSAWFELLLRTYGVGHWCLIVDADELLYYPDCEHKSLVQLCQELDTKDKHAFPAVLLEMYSQKPITETHYVRGQKFEDVCPYFDRQFYHTKLDNAGPYGNQTVYFGGVRQRVFGEAGGYYLSKVPLLKYTPDVVLAGGQHWTSYAKTAIADESGCLLHFKFFANFSTYVTQEAQREEHSLGASQYKEYAKGLRRNESLRLYDEEHSVRLRDSQQLVDLDIMQDGRPPKDSSVHLQQIEFPPIAQLAPAVQRPFWSVMITVYNRVQYLAHALRSVVAQAPGPDTMQIEVINDGGVSREIRQEIASVVRAVAGDRVTVHYHPTNLGHPHIFNLCLQRAQGHWIHLLHDDDWVEPGFYRALQRGIEQAPEIGAAFCRHKYIDTHGDERRLSRLEQETPGVVNGWLPRIAEACWLQTPAIVVKRQVYEQLGGFCPQANSAFDWEMWKRIAVHYPFWYEPQPLACFRQHPASESDGLIRSGQQLADTRRAIEISLSYLPKAIAEELSNAARTHYAFYALSLAQQQLQTRQYESALANIREGLACSRSEPVQRALIALLLNS